MGNLVYSSKQYGHVVQCACVASITSSSASCLSWSSENNKHGMHTTLFFKTSEMRSRAFDYWSALHSAFVKVQVPASDGGGACPESKHVQHALVAATRAHRITLRAFRSMPLAMQQQQANPQHMHSPDCPVAKHLQAPAPLALSNQGTEQEA